MNYRQKLANWILPGILAGLFVILAGCLPGPAPALTTATPLLAPPTSRLVTSQPAVQEPTLQASPVPDSSTIPAPYLYELAMVNETAGWGLSDGMVLYTADGGKRWFDRSPAQLVGQKPPLEGYFLDGSSGWIITPDDQDPNTGILYQTSDAGQTWTPINVPFGFAQLQFLDPLNGWAMADRGAGAGSMAVDLYQTSDGGTTWSQVYTIKPENADGPNDLPFSGIKSGMSFRDAKHGWVTGSIPMDGFAYLYATQDGGKTWSHQDLPLPSGWESAMLSIEPPRFFDDKNGVLPLSSYSQAGARVFYVTQDGGASWMPTTALVSVGITSTPTARDFFAWDGGTLHASHDSGQTWTEITPNIDLTDILAQMDFVSPSTGWASSVDADGKFQLYLTGDGGATWEGLLK